MKTHAKKGFARAIAALGAALIVGAFAVDSPSYAGQEQGANADRDQTQLQDRTGKPGGAAAVESAIFEGDSDQERQRNRDGSCGGDCDGEGPDQDRQRKHDGEEQEPDQDRVQARDGKPQ